MKQLVKGKLYFMYGIGNTKVNNTQCQDRKVLKVKA